MIRMSDVSMEYDNGVRAVKKATLRIDEGEFVFLVGPSGSGKSTLIKLLTGEVKPTSGRIVVNNYNIGAIKKREIPYLRRTLGVVFQDFRLIEKKTVYENVAFAMRAVGAKNRAIRKRVPYVLDLVGLSEKADTRPLELSGGEQQRVAIARALVNNPRLIIADEPTGNLDPARSYELMTLFEKINELGTTILIVTHEKELVDEFEKRVIMIDSGEIVSDATGRYYADDDYYDEQYVIEEQEPQQDIKNVEPDDVGNASLTMLFERLNVKKTDDDSKFAQSMDEQTKQLDLKAEENLQNEAFALKLQDDSEKIVSDMKILSDDDNLKDEINLNSENDNSDNEQALQLDNQAKTEIYDEQNQQADNQTSVEQTNNIAEKSDDINTDAENMQKDNENVNQEQTQDSNLENTAEVIYKPDLSQISSRIGMNTSMMKRQTPQRIKTNVGNVDASLEELIQRFEKRVGIQSSSEQMQTTANNPKQAGGEIENEQKNAKAEASEQ